MSKSIYKSQASETDSNMWLSDEDIITHGIYSSNA